MYPGFNENWSFGIRNDVKSLLNIIRSNLIQLGGF